MTLTTHNPAPSNPGLRPLAMICAACGIVMLGIALAGCATEADYTATGERIAARNGLVYAGQHQIKFGGYRGGETEYLMSDGTWR